MYRRLGDVSSLATSSANIMLSLVQSKKHHRGYLRNSSLEQKTQEHPMPFPPKKKSPQPRFWRFPKSWGYPQLSSIFMALSMVNHPFGVPPLMEKSPYLWFQINVDPESSSRGFWGIPLRIPANCVRHCFKPSWGELRGHGHGEKGKDHETRKRVLLHLKLVGGLNPSGKY